MSHAAFLKAICASPEDDTARLVYADYLDDQGGVSNAARAEFIRLQIRLATLDETNPDRPALEDRENELLRVHERAWVGKLAAPLASGLFGWRFERGFLDAVRITSAALASHGTALCNRHPIGRVRFAHSSEANDREAVNSLTRKRWWPRVRELDTGDAATDAFEALLVSSQLTGLRRLVVNAHAYRDPAPRLSEVLAECRSLPGLQELHLRDWPNYPAELLPVLEASGVRALRLSSCNFTSRGLKSLLSSAFAARPVQIELENGNLGARLWPALHGKKVHPVISRICLNGFGRNSDLDLPTLLSAPATANLHALDVSETNLSGAKVREIVQSGFLARATEIGLTRCHVNATLMTTLANTDAPHLRKLTLGETGLHNAGVFALCDARWADTLTHLDLMRNYLDDQALIAMANSGRFVILRSLDLRVNSPDLGNDCRTEIGDAGVIALASAPNLARLRSLNLYRTRVTGRGVEALLNGDHCRLAELELGGYDLGADLPAVLAKSPGLSRLTKLSISFTPTLGGDALLPLAESPYLSPLCRLDIRYNNVSERVSTKLAARVGHRLDNYPTAGTW